MMDEAVVKAGGKYKNLVVMCADSAVDFGIHDFPKFFEERFFNMGLGYANMVSAACGFAVRGKVVVIFGDSKELLGRAYDQIVRGVCEMNLNVNFVVKGKENGDAWRRFENIEVFESLDEMLGHFGPGVLMV